MSWQPIETAPKDGTSVLLWKHGRAIVEGHWNMGGAFNLPHWSTPTSLFAPTHWMPLPALPDPPLPGPQEAK